MGSVCLLAGPGVEQGKALLQAERQPCQGPEGSCLLPWFPLLLQRRWQICWRRRAGGGALGLAVAGGAGECVLSCGLLFGGNGHGGVALRERRRRGVGGGTGEWSH